MEDDRRLIADLLVRQRWLAEEERRRVIVPSPHPAEGRRGRERRVFLEQCQPDEVPVERLRRGDPRERARQTRQHDRDQIERLVQVAAKQANLYPHAVGAAVGAFLEAVATELVAGRAVPLPGFACLVARPTRPHPRRRQRLYVAFAAHRNLSVRTCEWARLDEAEVARFESYRHDARPSGRSRRAIAELPEERIRKAWRHVGCRTAAQRVAS